MRPPPVLVSVVLASLAGCSASPADAGRGAFAAGLEEGEAGLRGTVVDDTFAPVVGATVTVEGHGPVTSEEGGQFHAFGIAPGSHRVLVEAAFFKSQERAFDFAEGEVLEVQFALERLPTDEGYAELLLIRGFVICDHAVLYSAGHTPPDCPLGERVSAYYHDVPDTWRYLVLEMDWQTAESMLLAATHLEGTCSLTDPCWGMVIGRPPLRLEGAPGSAELAREYALDGKKAYPEGAFELIVDSAYAGNFREEINATANGPCQMIDQAAGANPKLGCPFGIGYALGIAFDYFVTIFHREAPADPASYSAIPDG